MHFFGLMQPTFVNGKSWKKKDFLSPGKPCNLVFASPGNVCTNPDNNRIVNLASGVAYVGGGTGEGRVQAAGVDGQQAQTGCGRGYGDTGGGGQTKIALGL